MILLVSFVDVAADETGAEFVAVPHIGEPCLPRLPGGFGVVSEVANAAAPIGFGASLGEFRLKVSDDEPLLVGFLSIPRDRWACDG